jgi:hypothetical protein
LRIARFGTANEFGDWVTALHTFTYCNALHQAIKRCPSAELVRGVFHGAVSAYLDRFLNSRLPVFLARTRWVMRMGTNLCFS